MSKTASCPHKNTVKRGRTSYCADCGVPLGRMAEHSIGANKSDRRSGQLGNPGLQRRPNAGNSR
jgi:hypothetical protein